jgi:L-fuconolactonase
VTGSDAEDVSDPDLSICDPHHHLWDHPTSTYLVDELRTDIASGHRVERTVFVECLSAYRSEGPEELRPVGETEWVAGLDDGGLVAGIVGFADLSLGDGVEEVLAGHEEAGGGRFRGIRHATAFDPSPEIRRSHARPPQGLMAGDAFGRGIAALGRRGLTYDAWLYFHQIPELTALAQAHPDVVMVLDHLGGPLGIGPYEGRHDEVMAVWDGALAELARCENVVVKLGGIGMPIFGKGWHRRPRAVTSEELAATWGPPVHRVIERFGVDRCMFESNFPVDAASCSYLVLWNAFKRMTTEASPPERAALFSGTASRTYRLGP